jgi:predicted ATPase
MSATLKGTYGDFEIAATVDERNAVSTLQSPSEKLGRPLVEANLQKELARIWYLSASRSGVPPQLQVGTKQYRTKWFQPIEPDGSNAIEYLLERFTSRDPQWEVAENWLRRITPEASILKSPLRGNLASVETTDKDFAVDVNIAYQGTGIQKVLSTIAALVFSPEGSTIIVEEPEINLHPRSQEVLVDLFNLAVNDWKKQVIFSTHSWDMLQPFASDIGTGSPRGEAHIKAKAENFKLVVLKRVGDDIKIEELPIKGREYMYLRDYLKKLWG